MNTIEKMLMVLLGLCVSCSSGQNPATPTRTVESLWMQPLATPSFVAYVDTTPVKVWRWSEAICGTIRQDVLWRQGDSADELDIYLSENTSVAVDNQILPEEKVFLSSVTTLNYEYGPLGNLLGSWGGPLTICFSAEQLSKGLHLASIQTETISGEPFTYSWAFHVGDEEGTTTP